MKKTFCVGLTGLIGTGKSTICEVFRGLGVPLYDCDSRAKELMGSVLKEKIVAQFGPQSYDETGKLNRQFLATKVFSDAAERKKMEEIVHPAVGEDLKMWLKKQSAPYCVVESAILVGNVIEEEVDHLVVTTADREVIIARVMRRDGATEAQVEERLAAQMDQQKLVERADSLIKTSESELIVPKVVALHEKLLTLSLEQ